MLAAIGKYHVFLFFCFFFKDNAFSPESGIQANLICTTFDQLDRCGVHVTGQCQTPEAGRAIEVPTQPAGICTAAPPSAAGHAPASQPPQAQGGPAAHAMSGPSSTSSRPLSQAGFAPGSAPQVYALSK